MMFRLLLFISVGLVLAGKGPFSGHKVIRVVPKTQEQLQRLDRFLQTQDNLDVWKSPSSVNSAVDIRVTPEENDDVTNSLRLQELEPAEVISDVQTLADSQLVSSVQNLNTEFESKYHTYDEILQWLRYINETYSHSASLFSVAVSYEERDVAGIKISKPSLDGTTKPAFWIQGGIHAREWISPATVIYMTSQMLKFFDEDSEETAKLKEYDWYILPVTNPDGYSYTWTQDRLWRKTRSINAGSSCIGVDPNRNWDEQWGARGASRNPCSNTYCGPKPFSEVEVRGVADFINTLPNLAAFIDIHSYSQLWLSPWGYTNKRPRDYKQQDDAGKAAVNALAMVYGTEYEHGTISKTIYTVSGGSVDWTYGKAGIKYSYGVELRDKGKFGFLLPEDQIVESGEETMAAVAAMAKYILENP